MKRFWMVVYIDGDSVGAPTVRRETLEAAEAEAARLVNKHRHGFAILEAISVIRPVQQNEKINLIP